MKLIEIVTPRSTKTIKPEKPKKCSKPKKLKNPVKPITI